MSPPLLPRRGACALALALLCAAPLLAPAAARADALENQIRQESLLRRYSSAEAEERYQNYRRDNDAAREALGSGLTNLSSRLAARAREQMREAEASRDLWQDLWFKVDIGKPVKVRNARDGKLMAEMLLTNHDHSWRAAKLLVEHMLWLHEDSPLVFPQPQELEAARLLRLKTYGLATRHAWAVNMLGKLYLAGVGVPRDEEEALRLFLACPSQGLVSSFQGNSAEDMSAVNASCLLNAATIYEKGWGVMADAGKAAELRDRAAALYNQGHDTRYSAADLVARIQP